MVAHAPFDRIAGLPTMPPEDVLFGHSEGMAAARAKLTLAAGTNVPVLLQGESGTGKEIMARLLHVRSQRSRFPWIKVICPAIPDALIESELFGYEKGAFSGAYATKRGRVELAEKVDCLEVTGEKELLDLCSPTI